RRPCAEPDPRAEETPPMAKDKTETRADMVEVPAAQLAAMQARLEALERAELLRQHAVNHHGNVIDRAWEQAKKDIDPPASVRTQELAARKWGTSQPRFRCRLDSTQEDGKPGPRLDELFPLDISAHSDVEAGQFYLMAMGVRSHSYRLVVEPVPA